MAAVLLLMIVSLSGWMFYQGRLALWDGVKRTGANLTMALDRDIARNLTFYDLSLRSARAGFYSAEISSLSQDARALAMFDGAAKARNFGPIDLVARDGSVIASSRAASQSPPLPFDDDLRAHENSVEDELEISARHDAMGDLQLFLSRRLNTAEGHFGGIVRGSIDVTLFEELFERMDVGTGGVVSLLLDDGTLLARKAGDDLPVARIGQRFDVATVFSSDRSGTQTISSPVDGVNRLYTFRRIGNFPLLVSFGITTKAVEGAWLVQALIVGLILLLLLSVGVILLLVLRREWRQRGAAEQAAAEAAADYRLIADHVSDIISKTARDGTRTYVSPAYTRMLGYQCHEMVGTKSVDFAHPDDLPRVAGALEVCIAGTGQASCVYRTAHRDGRWIWVEARHRAVRDDAGELIEIVSAIRDITSQKQSEEELACKTGMLDAILANMPDGVCLFDAQQRMVAWNVQLWDILDLDRGTVLAASNPTEAFWRVMAERGDYGQIDPTTIARERIRAMATGERIDNRRRMAMGKWVERRGTPMPDGGSLSIYRDVDQEVLRELDLRQAYEQVERQATDLAAIAEQAEAAQIEAEAARTAADEASRAKSDFLAKMSHEIRTPLNGILGFSDLLLDSTLDTEQSRLVRIVRDAGQSLLAIINDILDVSKIEAGKLQLECIPLSIVSVADGALSIVRPQAGTKPVSLEIEEGPGIPAWILGDPTRLRQVFLNLLSNAVKFTDRGYVRLSLAYEPLALEGVHDGSSGDRSARGRLTVAVSDSGIGIHPARQSMLFQNFHQADVATTRKYGGTGLGLAICRNLVEAMGGDIEVASAEGQGSTFSFTIEVAETAPVQETESLAVTRVRERPIRILVAEDLDMNQLIVQRMLQAAGHEVTLVDNGAEALDALRHGKFDLLLMDMEMPVMTGLEAAEAIRASSEHFSALPIIALTANSMSAEIERCYRAGMNGHLSKPIERARLLEAVERAVSTAEGATHGDASPLALTPELLAPAQAPKAVAVLDLELLASLETRIGADQVAKFVHMFRDQLGRTMASIAGTRDSGALAADAHILISLAGNLGLNELSHAARLLMNAARQATEETTALAAALPAVAQRARTALDTRYPCLEAA